MEWAGTWPGGRVRRLDDGMLRYYLIRRLGSGVRKSIALDVRIAPDPRTPTGVPVDPPPAAMAELALFNRDPGGYKTRTQQAGEDLARAGTGTRLTDTLLEEFLLHCDERVKRGDLTEQYKKQILAPYLGQWVKALGGRDIRSVTLLDLKRTLKGWQVKADGRTWIPAEHKRVIVLKALTAWMREEKGLRRQDDPTLDLKTPEIVPEKSVRAKGYPMRVVERVYAELGPQEVRDVFLMRAKTGMHDTEIDRLARGEGVLRPVREDPSGIAGVIAFPHLKKKQGHSLSVDAQTLAAAERLQLRGRGVTRMILKRAVDRACAAAKVEPAIHPGQLRHSFATWATTVGEEVHAQNQRGVDLTKVAERMGHLGKRTTAMFYVDLNVSVPMMVKLPLRLVHPEDPPLTTT
jgi:integrase